MHPLAAAFVAMSEETRKLFGDAEPQSGEPYFRSSAALHELESTLAENWSSSDWDGPAATAYAKAAAKQRLRVGKMSDLDARMGAQIDRSAYVAVSGRNKVEEIRKWVIDNAGTDTETGAGTFQAALAVSRGCEDLGELTKWAQTEHDMIASGMNSLKAEYESLESLELPAGEGLPGFPGENGPDRPKSLDDILKDYQVPDDPDGIVKMPGLLAKVFGDREFTATEVKLLSLIGAGGIFDMYRFEEQAKEEAKRRFPPQDGAEWDNHTDAFRHAYWNALMTKRFGKEWTEAYAKAHEGIATNNPASEAMDLYNNEVGRNIAVTHPDASPEELAELVQQAVNNGETVVVRPDGQGLAWSDQLTSAETGNGGRSAPVHAGTPTPQPEYRPYPG